MRTPSQQDIAVDPELAILNVLGAASDMAIAILKVFHPAGDDPEAEHCPSHQVANRIIADAFRLRRTLADYEHALNLERGTAVADFSF